MHRLPPALTGLVLSILASSSSSTAAGLPSGNSNASSSASPYTDPMTNITFLGYAPAATGFTFGMVLPTSPMADLIVQLVSPLQNGAGYGAVNFGASMTGHLMLAAWPDPGGGGAAAAAVRVSPRTATGYDVARGACPYTAANISVAPIAAGTFVNATHVAATFVCGGCVAAAAAAFTSWLGGAGGGAGGGAATTATFSYAYALTPVRDPGDAATLLSDHTLQGERYGPFDLALKSAESSEYEAWAALAGVAATAGGGSSPSSSSSSSPVPEILHRGEMSPALVISFVGLLLVYVLKAIQIV